MSVFLASEVMLSYEIGEALLSFLGLRVYYFLLGLEELLTPLHGRVNPD